MVPPGDNCYSYFIEQCSLRWFKFIDGIMFPQWDMVQKKSFSNMATGVKNSVLDFSIVFGHFVVICGDYSIHHKKSEQYNSIWKTKDY